MCAQKWRRLVFVAVGCALMALAGCGSCDDSVGGGGGGVGLDGGDSGDVGDSATFDVEPDVATDVEAGADADAEQSCPQASQCAGECCEDGQECVDDQCMDPCEGTRCGGSMQLCCAGEEVCIFEGCHVPGEDCTNSFQCPEDQYCESTLSKCLPRDAVTEECTFRPPIGEFTPSSERSFGGVEHDGQTYDKSFTTPAVADVDADGIPEIVALFYRGSLGEALLAVIDSQTMDLIAYGGVGRVQNNSAGIAVADLDPSTPELEIVAQQDGGGLVAFRLDAANGELTEWWSNAEGPLGEISQESAPAIADLDGDGSAEVVLGLSVVGADGNIWRGINEGAAGGHNGSRVISAVADLDGAVDDQGNRNLELLAGNRALRNDGTVLWDVSDAVEDGYPAVGDFNGDAVPEVVTVSPGEVYVLSGADGSVIFGPRAIPGGGEGGPPTIADFDGDGRLEFSAAGQGRYTVYDLDCQGSDPDPAFCASERDDGILWSNEVQDLSSSRTGSSVFDFEGDGRAEVVYNDECFLRVYDGIDGTVLFEQANSTRTGSENPIVVDVDADFNAEIVVVSNNDQIDRDGCEDNYDNYPAGGTTGLFVYGDADNNWVPTRQIWNQHAYHITNVEDDGSVPAQQPLHYTSSITNSFRLNAQPDGLFNAPDLVVDEIGVRGLSCGDQITVEVEVTVKNDGSLGVGPGVEVEVRGIIDGNTEVIGTVQTATRLLPGGSETLTIEWTVAQDALDDGFELEATADAGQTTNECVEDNNEADLVRSADDLGLETLAIRQLDVRDHACGIASTVDITVEVANEGSATVPAGVPVVLEATRNSNRETIQTVQTPELAPGASEEFELTWSVPGSFYGFEFEVQATIDPEETTSTCASGNSDSITAECVPEG